MHRIVFILCYLLLHEISYSQNGTILFAEEYVLADSMISSRIKYYPKLKENCTNVICKRIIYQSDSIPVKGYLIQPKTPGIYPCIIYNRGGHGEFGTMTDAFTAKLIEYASMGFVVIASQYRGGCSDCEGNDEIGGRDINDVINLFPIIDRMPNVDTSSIVMIGASRGGINTCQAITKTNRIKLAMLLYSPANLFTNVIRYPEMENVVLPQFLSNYWENRDSILTTRSPVYWTNLFSKKTTVIILHGKDDKRAFYEEAVQLYDNLKKDSVNVILETFENGNHGLSSDWELFSTVSKFYLRLIKEKKDITIYKRH